MRGQLGVGSAHPVERGRQPSADELTRVARGFLQNRYLHEGIAFRGALNPIIGGIKGIDVRDGTQISVQNLGGEGKIARVTYTLQVQLKDKYQFVGNIRSGGCFQRTGICL